MVLSAEFDVTQKPIGHIYYKNNKPEGTVDQHLSILIHSEKGRRITS
jgi:hypothetical protein